MRLGIDASNISKGGGLTHLVEILRFADETATAFSEILVWSSKKTLDALPSSKKLVKMHLPVLDRSIFYRTVWQKREFPGLLKQHNCDILFCPGGPSSTVFTSKVTMSRNMHPFIMKELFRYSILSPMAIKYLFIRAFQPMFFRKYDGLIFLNTFARDSMMPIIKRFNGKTGIIPHGVNTDFICPPKKARAIADYSPENKFRILYVSKIDVHKHQANVVVAMIRLHKEGLPVHITFIGPIDSQKEYRAFKNHIDKYEYAADAVEYIGNVAYNQLPVHYHAANLFIFASSCENMPNILLEAMASGLPIASSSYGPMPLILKDGGCYFDPEKTDDIYNAIKSLVNSENARQKISEKAFLYSQEYSWKKCSLETFNFLSSITNSN